MQYKYEVYSHVIAGSESFIVSLDIFNPLLELAFI